MLAKATAFSPRRRSRAMRSKVGPWKRGEHEVVEAALFDRLRDELVTFGATHELVDGHRADAVERLDVVGQALEVDHTADVAAALAEEDAGPHRAPPAAAAAVCRAPMRSRNGSTSWE